MTATLAPPLADFDLCGPLPTGTTVLEASAGTGKTHTIASLAVRYLAEGAAELGELMLVTFGRMASTELRQRVRARLVAVEAALAAALAGDPAPPDDPLVALLAAVPGEELGRRRGRLARALADFDAATIATTHEFCLQMLDGLGVLGDREPEAVFVEQVTDLTREAATDLYLRRYATWDSPPMSYPEAVQIAQQAVAAGHCRLAPDPDGAESGDRERAAERVGYAAAARDEVAARLRRGRLFTYDDMLTRLRDALADPVRGPLAAERLRARYRVVMVDEFQDTDPVQWEILQRAFVGRRTLILIGDPKQAIYAFRGADVYSYLDAVAQADRVLTLSTNWRSDAALLDGLDRLLGGAALGEPEIVVRPVRPDRSARRLRSRSEPATAAPLRLRVLPHPPDADRVAAVSALRPRITADLVADVTAALTSDLELDLGDGPPRRLWPADVAVLVHTNSRGEDIRDALVAAHVPAVLLGSGSVFASELAEDWLTLLVALEQPRQGTVRQAALTSFVGWTFARLAAADEPALSDLTQRVRGWSRVLAGRGVAALIEAVGTDTGLVERLLASSGGERRLTDLRHLGQSLHAAMVSGQLGVSALVEWLRARMAEARATTAPEGTRRLETDARAVSVLTVHRSKGLEFPVVYLPDAWDRHVTSSDDGAILRLHDPAADVGPDSRRGGCVLDVGGRWGPGRGDRWRRSQDEDAGEDLRLFYVAATRAQCQLVTWWAASHNTPASALQRLLHRSAGDVGTVPAPAYELTGDPFGARDLGPQVGLETVTERPVTPYRPPAHPPAALVARRFERTLDTEWRRTSYSALTAAAHGPEPAAAGVASEPEPAKEDDEAADAAPELRPGEPGGAELGRPSPMADLPSGADFGLAVHAVLEAVDPRAGDLAAELRRACRAVLGRLPAGSFTADQLADALHPALLTPLGPLAGSRTLADIGRGDRLAELGFELPLAGGETTTGDLVLGDLVPLLRAHLPAGDRLGSYPDALADPALAGQTLRGFLTGSIDAVLRVPGADGEPRYLVVDYKTNRLGPPEVPLTLSRYTPARMADAMVAAHYPLQALLYAVAVHRLLRWRQPTYHPERHLGGVLYLFVRGMAGPDTPQVDGVPCGVFSWRPPNALVAALSDLLDGDRP